MTQEEKELLLKDLSARLPYGVICNDNRHGSSRVTNIDITPDDIEHKNPKVVLYYFDFDECGELKNCKPYLRPMSSMTEEELEEIFRIIHKKHKLIKYEKTEDRVRFNSTDENGVFGSSVFFYDVKSKFISIELLDWLNAHHFDYRGLIEKGLAIEAPEGMYKID